MNRFGNYLFALILFVGAPAGVVYLACEWVPQLSDAWAKRVADAGAQMDRERAENR